MFKVGFIYPANENLGIECLSACLKSKGFETKLFLDPVLFAEHGFINNKLLANIFSFKKNLLQKILDYQPDLLCFSVVTDYYQWSREWAKKIKGHISSPIVFGGIHPTSVPERVIRNSFVDYVCVGEGDEAIVDLAEALAYKRPTDAIKNIWSKMNGVVIQNSVRDMIADINVLPFPDKELFYSAAPIVKNGYTISTSRGCPYSCSYCCNNVWKKVYEGEKQTLRRRSVDNVIEELRIAKEKYQSRYIHFLDEVFVIDKEWLENFLQKYKKEIDLPFFCFAYPDLLTENIIIELKKAGCYKIQMGVQVIDEYNRRMVLMRDSSNEVIARAIDLLKREKIYIVCDTIFGFPHENTRDLENIAYFYDKHLPNHIEIFWLRYYPKSGITHWAAKQGYINQEKMNEIEDGMLTCGIVRGGDHISDYAKKFIVLFYLFFLLPHKLRVLIISKKLYKYFPARFMSIYLYLLKKLCTRAQYDFHVSRTIRRYVYFIVKKLSCVIF